MNEDADRRVVRTTSRLPFDTCFCQLGPTYYWHSHTTQARTAHTVMEDAVFVTPHRYVHLRLDHLLCERCRRYHFEMALTIPGDAEVRVTKRKITLTPMGRAVQIYANSVRTQWRCKNAVMHELKMRTTRQRTMRVETLNKLAYMHLSTTDLAVLRKTLDIQLSVPLSHLECS